MKLKVTAIAAFIAMIGFAQANASEPTPTLAVTRKDASGIFMVNYRGAKDKNVKMIVKDNNGKVLSTESIKGLTNFLRPVNFNEVGTGIYTIEIDNGLDKQTETINYSNIIPPTYAHVANLGEGRYLLTSSHAGKEKINIKIYNNAKDLVFEQDQSIEGNFAMVFNLKNVDGQPSFVVTDTAGRSDTISY